MSGNISQATLRKRLHDAALQYGDKTLARAADQGCYGSIFPRLLKSASSAEIFQQVVDGMSGEEALLEIFERLHKNRTAFYSIFSLIVNDACWYQKPRRVNAIAQAINQECIYDLADIASGKRLVNIMDGIGRMASASQSQQVLAQCAGLTQEYGGASLEMVIGYLGNFSSREGSKLSIRRNESSLLEKIAVFMNKNVSRTIGQYGGMLRSYVIREFGFLHQATSDYAPAASMVYIFGRSDMRRFLTGCKEDDSENLVIELGKIAYYVKQEDFEPALSGLIKYCTPEKAIKVLSNANFILELAHSGDAHSAAFGKVVEAGIKHDGIDFDAVMKTMKHASYTGDQNSISSVQKLAAAYEGVLLHFFMTQARHILSGPMDDNTITGSIRSFSHYFSQPDVSGRIRLMEETELLFFTSNIEHRINERNPSAASDFARTYLRIN